MRKLLAALIFLNGTLITFAQSDTSTKMVYQAAVQHALTIYQQFRGGELNLYKGLALEQSNWSGASTPYFGNDDWQNGSVFYEGVRYDGVRLKYNLARDEVIVLNPATRNAFYLFKPRVDWFILAGKTFIHLKKEAHSAAPGTGYYEQLVKGRLTLLEKHTKTYQESFRNNNIEKRFDESRQLYAGKDGKFHKISGAKALYNLTGSLKNRVRDQVRQQRASSGKDPRSELIAIAETFNQLSE